MFWRFVLAAVKFRRRRLLLAFSGLAVTATLATALFSIYSDIDRKMRHEFRGYGANLVIAPAGNAQTVPVRAVAEAERLGAVAAPFLYTIGRIGDERVVVAGVDFGRAAPLTSYWQVAGAHTAMSGECLAGSALAAHFHREHWTKLAAGIRRLRGSRYRQHRRGRGQPRDGPLRSRRERRRIS